MFRRRADAKKVFRMMMMSAGCGIMCAGLLVLSVLSLALASGDRMRKLQAAAVKFSMRMRGVPVVDAAFYGHPGQGWLAVTVASRDGDGAPFSFHVPDYQANPKGVWAAWLQASEDAVHNPAAG